jgi:hypothetical protein
MHDSLRHASKEGRLEFLQKIFKLFADFHSNLEDEIIEKQENLDRAIWLYTSDLSIDRESKEAWMKVCEKDLADAQTQMADFLSLLWDVKDNPSEWIQKYHDEVNYLYWNPEETAQSALPEDGYPQAAVPSRAKKTAGRPARAQQATIRQMNTDLEGGALTEAQLRVMPITSLAELYRVHHTVAKKARERVLLDRASGRGQTSCANSAREFAQQNPANKTNT